MTQTLTGVLRGNVITLDVKEPVLEGSRKPRGQRVRVALEPLAGSDRSPQEDAQLENRRLLAQINEAVADGPDSEERKLRKRMRRRLRRRELEW